MLASLHQSRLNCMRRALHPCPGSSGIKAHQPRLHLAAFGTGTRHTSKWALHTDGKGIDCCPWPATPPCLISVFWLCPTLISSHTPSHFHFLLTGGDGSEPGIADWTAHGLPGAAGGKQPFTFTGGHLWGRQGLSTDTEETDLPQLRAFWGARTRWQKYIIWNKSTRAVGSLEKLAHAEGTDRSCGFR